MTSKERVRAAIMHKVPDKVPTNFECTGFVRDKLLKHYSLSSYEQLLQKFEIDIRQIGARYNGPALGVSKVDGDDVFESPWGWKTRYHDTGFGVNGLTCYYPLDQLTTVEQLLNYPWPSPDWFDYEGFKQICDLHQDKAIMIGHEGPFQIATFLRSMEKLFTDMAIEPEFAKTIFDKMVEYELELYERLFIAADGQIDILRTHDDYGTQISLLFSVDMWTTYFRENTAKLANLAHKYGAFFQQHSCGCVGSIIPKLIECGVDVLEPLQKVNGLEPEFLKQAYGDVLAFQGGIDTQQLLPFGTADEVRKEVRRYIDLLNINGGYILMASQGFEGDVPVENIEAVYALRN